MTILSTLLNGLLELGNGLLAWLIREPESIVEASKGRSILSLPVVGTHHQLLGSTVGYMRVEHLHKVIVAHRISLGAYHTDSILMASLCDSKVLESLARVCIGLAMHCREISDSNTSLILSLHASERMINTSLIQPLERSLETSWDRVATIACVRFITTRTGIHDSRVD